MAGSDASRLAIELELLQAMYPEQIEYSSRSRDFKYAADSALLHLRLPETYPEALPEVISANNASKRDLRDRVKQAISECGIAEGEEALDAVIAAFRSIIVAECQTSDTAAGITTTSASSESEPQKTVIIWLHHLLALSKRKLALSPSRSSISGVTKPGYPGVMVFSGPTSAVDDHVNTLKTENWQAFQVRYEALGLWEFVHGAGIREVETMADAVKCVEVGANGARRKEEFLQAVGIK
jgi:hypothetical protein